MTLTHEQKKAFADKALISALPTMTAAEIAPPETRTAPRYYVTSAGLTRYMLDIHGELKPIPAQDQLQPCLWITRRGAWEVLTKFRESLEGA